MYTCSYQCIACAKGGSGRMCAARVTSRPRKLRFTRVSFLRFGYFLHRRRKLVVALWALLVLISLPLAPRAPGVMRVGGFSAEQAESAQAVATLQRNLDFKATNLSIIFSSDEWTVDDPRFAAATAEALRDLPNVPEVAEVIPYTTNPRQI